MISLRISKWRTRKSWPSNASLALREGERISEPLREQTDDSAHVLHGPYRDARHAMASMFTKALGARLRLLVCVCGIDGWRWMGKES